MWGWYLFSSGISTKKIWDQTVHHKQLIQSVWKLIGHPVHSFDYVFYFSDVPEYWPELENDLTKVVWSHATNSQEKLKKALEGKSFVYTFVH